MTITNVGYDGTVNGAAFNTHLAPHFGAGWQVVCGRFDLLVEANPAVTRGCTVQPGSAAGQGVKTTSDAVAPVSHSAVATAGQSRWDAVVLRRNWGTSTSTIVVVEGVASVGAAMTIPSGVDLTADSTLDMLLALVRIDNGVPTPVSVVDMRMHASKVFTAAASAALPTPSVALYGMTVIVAGVQYRCLADDAGVLAWVRDAVTENLASDSGYPAQVATSSATPAAPFVADRFTIGKSPFARRINIVSSAYVASSIAGVQVNYVVQSSSPTATLGYGRITCDGPTPHQIVCVGTGVIEANVATTISLGLSKQPGSGTFSSSTSQGLTTTAISLARI